METTTALKTVILVDTSWTGHIPTYHKLFVKVLLQQGCFVVSLSPAADEVSQWTALHLPEAKTRLAAITFNLRWADRNLTGYAHERNSPSFAERMLHLGRTLKIPYIAALGNSFYTFWTWRAAYQAIQAFVRSTNVTPDLVFISFVDWNFMATGITKQMIDRIFPYRWSGLYFNPTKFRLSGEIKKAKTIRLSFPAYDIFRSKNMIALSVLDEGTIERLHSYIGKPVIFFPDITNESVSTTISELARRITEKAAGRKIIGLFGSLSSRKGMKTLLKAAEQFSRTHDKYFFVFAGPFYAVPPGQETEEIKQMKSSDEDNCFFHLEPIADGEDFNELICLCNVVFAAYHNFYHSSNILTKTARFHKPVIVSEGYCMGARVKKYRLGLTIPEGDMNRCIEAIHCLCAGKDQDGNPLRPDFEGFYALHSQEKLSVAFKEILQYV